MKIDLAKEKDEQGLTTAPGYHDDDGPRYPCVYLHDQKGIEDLKQGDEFTGTVCVRSITKTETNGETEYSAELELRDIDTGSKPEKPETMKKKASTQKDDEMEIEKGLDEAEKETSKKKEEY